MGEYAERIKAGFDQRPGGYCEFEDGLIKVPRFWTSWEPALELKEKGPAQRPGPNSKS